MEDIEQQHVGNCRVNKNIKHIVRITGSLG